MRFPRVRFWLFVLVVGVVAAAVASAGMGSSAKTKPVVRSTILHPGPALKALIAAAKAEGSLTFYTVPPDPAVRRVVDDFSKRYGVNAKWIRFTSGDLQARLTSETNANAPTADMIIISNSTWFQNAVGNGMLVPPSKAGIPGWPRGYPAKFRTRTGSAIIQLQPNNFAINTRLLSRGDAPKDWPDLLKPQYKDKILLVDPRTSPAYTDLWWLIQRKYGLNFITRLRAQAKSQLYSGSSPITNALAAGEGAIAVPDVPSIVSQARDRGAPLDFLVPSLTTGPEQVVALTSKAKNKAAARLFLYFLLTPRGQGLLNDDPGSVSVWNLSVLPKAYTRVDPNVSVNKRDDIYKAFGLG